MPRRTLGGTESRMLSVPRTLERPRPCPHPHPSESPDVCQVTFSSGKQHKLCCLLALYLDTTTSLVFSSASIPRRGVLGRRLQTLFISWNSLPKCFLKWLLHIWCTPACSEKSTRILVFTHTDAEYLTNRANLTG